MRLSMPLGAAVLLTLCAFQASAQFTGVVVPPRAKVVAAADTAPKTVAQKRDSVASIKLTNMKDWVDSAAATLGVPAAPVVTDTTATAPAVPPVVATVPEPAGPPRATTEFHEGAPAPNTATPIPTLALIGLGSLAAGLWLLRRRRA